MCPAARGPRLGYTRAESKPPRGRYGYGRRQAEWAEWHRRRVDAAAEAEDSRREFAAERDDLGLVIQPRLRLACIGSALVVADL